VALVGYTFTNISQDFLASFFRL